MTSSEFSKVQTKKCADANRANECTDQCVNELHITSNSHVTFSPPDPSVGSQMPFSV